MKKKVGVLAEKKVDERAELMAEKWVVQLVDETVGLWVESRVVE